MLHYCANVTIHKWHKKKQVKKITKLAKSKNPDILLKTNSA